MRHDVVVVGGGPAGAALARSLRTRGVDVLVVSPSTPWLATYGAWEDDVVECETGAPLASLQRGRWNVVRVVAEREHLLQRPYMVFDNQRTRSALFEGVATIDDSVIDVQHDLDTSTVRLHGGAKVVARLVVDATGSGVLLAHRPEPSSRRSDDRAGGAQTAYGLVVDSALASATGIRPGEFTLMDWSRPPTFFYGASFPDGSTLIEETSLYARPPVPIEPLRERLVRRMEVDLTSSARAVEHVRIPMGAPLPARTTRVVGFGASAGYVHPVTGYSVAASLRAAPRVAEAIRVALVRRRSGGDVSGAVWDAVWPQAQIRTRAWYDMGLAVLQSLPAESLPDFFDAFFSLPTSRWAAYLRVDADPRDVRATMLGVFGRVSAATRLRLMSSPGAMWRALVAR